MQPNPVHWFEIPVTDLERATAFYEAVFQTQLQRNDMDTFRMAWFPMAEGAFGAPGSLIQGESYVPSHAGSLVYLSVDDIEATLARVEQHGGRVLMPKSSIGEYGFVAHFEDSEGNRVSLHAKA
jgi:hypothetical protein